MNLCPSFPSIMLLRIWGTQRRRLRATEPGHLPAGTQPSGVARATHRLQGWGVSHHAGTQGTATQLPSQPWPHGSCAGAFWMQRSPVQAGGAECPLQLRTGGVQPVPRELRPDLPTSSLFSSSSSASRKSSVTGSRKLMICRQKGRDGEGLRATAAAAESRQIHHVSHN